MLGGAYYITLINVALAAMLLFGFAGFWLYDRSRKAPLFFFFATVCFLISASLGVITRYVSVEFETLFRFALNSVNLIAGTLLTGGVMIQYKLKPHWRRMGLFVALGLVVIYSVLDMPRQSVLRLSLNQAPIVIMLAMGTIRLIFLGRNSPIDNLLKIILAIFTLNLASRPVILAMNGTLGNTVADFHDTQYALIVQFSLALVIIATATILMLVLVADVVRDLTRENLRDSLTGLTNRKGFHQLARNILKRADMTNTPATLVMCDIDHFKAINDTHGHHYGDQAISFFGQTLGNITLKNDIAARVGGEEFCLLLWDTSLAEGEQLAENIRAVISKTALPFPTGDHYLSASFGVVQSQSGQSLRELYAMADAAMYQAKSDGRNRVRIAHQNNVVTNLFPQAQDAA